MGTRHIWHTYFWADVIFLQVQAISLSSSRGFTGSSQASSTILGNGRNTVSRVLSRRRELTEPHWVLRQTQWVLRKTRWVRFGTQIIGWEELTELSPGTQWGQKISLSSAFETVLSETVFGPFPIYSNLLDLGETRKLPNMKAYHPTESCYLWDGKTPWQPETRHDSTLFSTPGNQANFSTFWGHSLTELHLQTPSPPTEPRNPETPKVHFKVRKMPC